MTASGTAGRRIVGRYAIYDKIAAGGMATVHIGRLLGPVGFARTVAIKCMRSQLVEEPEFVSMFLDEARLAARIHHPNVVSILDVVAQEGELFLVMDYVKGDSLASLLRATQKRSVPMPPEMAVTLMSGVLHGLHAAHEALGERGEPLGIVHRDVSPQNVLVGIEGSARVVDFGVAKAAGRVQTTREGQLKGKIAYMAPEQLHGNVSRATDVYAASVVLWEALVGRRLFAAETDPEVYAKVLEGRASPPSTEAKHVPSVLDAIVMRGLSADPAARFATAYDMARALEEALPPVPASKIGEWVTDMVKDVLAKRAALVETVESDSALLAPAVLTSKERNSEELRTAQAAPSPAVDADFVPTQLPSGSFSSPGQALAAPRRKRGSQLAVTAGSAAVAAAILLAVALSRNSRHATTAGAPASSATPASPAPSIPPPASSSMAAVDAPPAPSASGVPVATDRPMPSAAPTIRPRRHPAPTRPAATTKRNIYDHAD